VALVRVSNIATLPLIIALSGCGSTEPDPGQDAGTSADGGQAQECSAAADPKMSFFVTEQGALSGNLGGLAGADARCAQAAEAVGVSGKTWVAYLSAENDATFGRVDAVDRIGDGPWFNAQGVEIGNKTQIHSQAIAAANIVSECQRPVIYEVSNPTGDRGAHDIFTGSTAEGTLERLVDPNTGLRSGPAATCGDWTSASPNDAAMVGHSDHETVDDTWNFAHYTVGCHEAGLRTTAANGRIYCFATN